MPDPREFPLKFVPRSVSDTVDGDNSPPGACMSLADLIYDPGTPGALQCRPANLKLSSFAGFNTPGVVSGGFVLGNIVYGLIGSAHFAGKDEPFAYNIITNTFQTVTGAIAANTPATQVTTGDWTPPTADMVGTRIIFTHPGFNFAGGFAFGYFDISGFTETLTGDTTNGSPVINGSFSIGGIGPGYTIAGTGIPANTTVLNTGNVNFNIQGTTHSNTTVDSITPGTSNMFVGQSIAGAGIPTGTTVASIPSGSSITISNAATASATVPLAVSGQTITMSANATSSNDAESITVAGGTAASPLWAAGNTTGAQQLLGVPQAVKQFNNRAYFAQSNNLIFTDTLSLNVSNSPQVQVLTVGDSTAITALGGLPEYQSTGGILQALCAFKANYISQITGDAATSNLDQNQLSGSVGTSSGRSVITTPEGLNFVANDGVRQINLIGEVSEPDADLALPFIYALHPSRVCAAFNSDIYRVCTQNAAPGVIGTPYQGYYYGMKQNGWTGPMSFRDDLILPYSNDFIVFNNALPGTMWQSFSAQDHANEGNVFVENGVQMTWQYTTCPMTDLENLYANCVIRSTLAIALPATGDVYSFQATDVALGVIGLATLIAPSDSAIWDAFDWGDGTLWGAEQFGLGAITIPWTNPLIFNKLITSARGNSSLALKLGSWHFGYERLNYLLR